MTGTADPRPTTPQDLFSSDFEDLAGGESFVSPGRTITEADIVSFAGLTGDHHPQHTDAEWSRRSDFGERIAHGMLVLSYAVGLVPLEPDRIVALRRIADAVFKRPVRMGDTIHVEGSLDRLKAVDDRLGLVTCTWKVLNQEGAIVVRLSIEVLWRRGDLVTDPEPREQEATPSDERSDPPAEEPEPAPGTGASTPVAGATEPAGVGGPVTGAAEAATGPGPPVTGPAHPTGTRDRFAPSGPSAAPSGPSAAPSGSSAAPSGSSAAPSGSSASPSGSSASPSGSSASRGGGGASTVATATEPTR